jgi:DNA polymerase zeta
MAEFITRACPSPITLKFEKVYFPSILMSKKRYCGYKFETTCSNPIFDAKGIETVRRDGCLLASKILKKSLMYDHFVKFSVSYALF